GEKPPGLCKLLFVGCHRPPHGRGSGMNDRQRTRLLIVSPHPVQVEEHVFRMAKVHPRLDLTVAYCSLPDRSLWKGPEFLTKGAFGLDLPQGYQWKSLRNFSPWPGLGRFFGLFNPAVIQLVKPALFDCCL